MFLHSYRPHILCVMSDEESYSGVIYFKENGSPMFGKTETKYFFSHINNHSILLALECIWHIYTEKYILTEHHGD